MFYWLIIWLLWALNLTYRNVWVKFMNIKYSNFYLNGTHAPELHVYSFGLQIESVRDIFSSDSRSQIELFPPGYHRWRPKGSWFGFVVFKRRKFPMFRNDWNLHLRWWGSKKMALLMKPLKWRCRVDFLFKKQWLAYRDKWVKILVGQVVRTFSLETNIIYYLVIHY